MASNKLFASTVERRRTVATTSNMSGSDDVVLDGSKRRFGADIGEMHNSGHHHHHHGHAAFEYMRDEWEKSPKTGYTYADSVSYNVEYDDNYVWPNMSRPGIRSRLENSHALNRQSWGNSGTESQRTPTILHSLRSRNIVDSLAPMEPEVSGDSIKHDTKVTHRRVETVMADGSNSPMYPIKRNTFAHLYSTDDVSSTKGRVERSGVVARSWKRFYGFLATLVTTVWSVVKYPVVAASRMMSRGSRRDPKRAAAHRRGDGTPLGHETHSTNENSESRRFLCNLIGTIGGIFNVLRNTIVHSCSAALKSSTRMDEAVLGRFSKNRTRMQMCCYLPLILLLASFILGGGYLYACGKIPSEDAVYSTGLAAWETVGEYYKSGYRASVRLKDRAVDEFYKYIAPSVHDPPSPPSPPSPPAATEPPRASEMPTPPLPERADDLERKLERLRMSVEDSMAKLWDRHESQAIERQESDHARLEALQADLEKFKRQFEGKLEELNQSRLLEEDDDKYQRLQMNLDLSLKALREEFQKVGGGQVDVDGVVQKSVELHLNQLFSDKVEVKKKFGSVLLSWLSENFADRKEMESRLQMISEELASKLNERFEERMKEVDESKKSLTASFEKMLEQIQVQVALGQVDQQTGSYNAPKCLVSPQDVEAAIRDALRRYDADKTGKTDYALETAGGSILGTRCSKTYKKGMAQLSVFGIPLWYANNSPRTVIQSGMLPGECWPFIGSVGYVVIQLATRVHVKEVSMEHVNINITTFGNIDSAPKDFSVWGLASPNDHDGVSLGNFSYLTTEEPLQTFPVDPKHHQLSFQYVELRVSSNHGNLEYTCLYRFRVHGTPDLSGSDNDK